MGVSIPETQPAEKPALFQPTGSKIDTQIDT